MIAEQVLNTSTLWSPSREEAGRACRGFEVRDVVYRAGARFEWHDHDQATMFVVLRGGVDEQWGRERCECAAGTVGYLPAAGRHRSLFASAPVHTLSVFLGTGWFGGTEEEGERAGESPGVASNEFVRAGALRLHALARWDDPARRLACEEIIVDLLGWACGTHVIGARAGRTGCEGARTRMRGVAAFLRESRGEELSLSRVSAAAGRNAAHVCREFRSAFGCSLSQYHMLARIEQASVLLRSTDRPLSRVALECGFYDQAQFSRAFRREMGVTPMAYRRAFVGGEESGKYSRGTDDSGG